CFLVGLLVRLGPDTPDVSRRKLDSRARQRSRNLPATSRADNPPAAGAAEGAAMAKVIKCECGYVARGETEVDLLVFTALWVVVLTGAVLIAALGANVLALTVLWLVVLAGAVLLVVAAYDDAGDDDTAAGAGVHAFVVTGVLTVLYLAAAGVAL